MSKSENKTFKKAFAGVLLWGVSSALYAASVGAVLPQTGASVSIGDDQLRGIELAVEKINAEGGVLGEPFKVIVEDSGGRAPSALDATKKLIDVNKVPIVMGEYSSGITIPIAQYLTGNNVVHLNIGSSSDQIRNLPDGTFSMLGLDDVSSEFAADDLMDLGYKTAVFIGPNNAYGQGVEKHLSQAFERKGGKMLSTLLYTPGQSTYRRELQQLMRAQPDVYVYSAYGQEASVINREAFDLGLNSEPWYGIYLTMCTTDTPPQAAEGHIGIELSAFGDHSKDYVAAYQEKYNENLRSAYSSYAYDGVILAAKAIELAGSTDPEAVKAAIKELGEDYLGITGEIVFDENGQRSVQPYDKVKYTNGQVVPR